MSILVTGATGNIGGTLIERLREQNAEFVAGVTNAAKAESFKQRGIEAVLIDFARLHTLIEAMRGIEQVFLLTPFGETMAQWTAAVVAAARRTGIERLVRLSGFGAYSGSDCLLNRIQGEIDRTVQDSGIPYTLLRPNAFMQNFAVYYAGTIRAQGAIYLPDGDGRTSFVDARDIAAVAAEILIHPEVHQNRNYDITGSEALGDGEIADIISAVTGRAVTYYPIDEDSAREGMRKAGMPEWNIEVLLSLSAFVRAGRASTVLTTVKDITGREPIRFEQFAWDYAEAW